MSRYAYFNQVGLKLWSVGKDRLHIGYTQSETSAKEIVAELNELLERADKIEADSILAIAALTADRDRLADENTELREDKARLDFMTQTDCVADCSTSGWVVFSSERGEARGDSIRAAIDAARKARA